MKAVLYRRSGTPEVLEYVEVADPDPDSGDVVIRVGATALNHLDIDQRSGRFRLPGFKYPHVAGMDVAGEIVETGSEVDGISIGDRVVVNPSMNQVGENSRYRGLGHRYGEWGVIGGTLDGGYAELCLVPATHVYPVPESMPIEHAATFPTSYLTARHALFEVGGLEPGESVMIHAAGSGVGSAAIQLAGHHGAIVLATAGTEEKCEKARALGADHAVNNRVVDVAAFAREVTDGRGVDMVFDHLGPALWAPSMFALGIGGRLVNCGGTTGDEATIPSLGHMYHSGIRILGSDAYWYEEFAPAWSDFCATSYEVVVDSEFALPEAAVAQQKMESSDFFGKIVLRP